MADTAFPVAAGADSADHSNQEFPTIELDIKNDTNDTGTGSSFNDAFFFSTVLQGLPSKLDVNWESIAEKAGYDDGDTAKAVFVQIKRKYLYQPDVLPAFISALKTPAKPRAKKGRSEKAAGSGTNNGASKVTKTRAPKKKPQVSKAQETAAQLGTEGQSSKVTITKEGGNKANLDINYQVATTDVLEFAHDLNFDLL